MLRTLFNEGYERANDTLFNQCIEQIEQFCTKIRELPHEKKSFSRLYRLELTAQSFKRALDELEQSIHCSRLLAEGLVHETIEEMDEEEVLNYHRHLYFYKNSFVRVFSTLDKLGYFMNEIFEARTERIKAKFSYFTVLRQISRRHIQPALGEQLNEYKTRYQEAMQRLRKKRNLEIHYVNIEILDDLSLQKKEFLDFQHIEDLNQNLADLTLGYEMVCRSLLLIFQQAKRHL